MKYVIALVWAIALFIFGIQSEAKAVGLDSLMTRTSAEMSIIYVDDIFAIVRIEIPDSTKSLADSLIACVIVKGDTLSFSVTKEVYGCSFIFPTEKIFGGIKIVPINGRLLELIPPNRLTSKALKSMFLVGYHYQKK